MLKLPELERKATFFRELATLIGAGITMGMALEALRGQTPPGRLRMAAIEGTAKAHGGRPFSEVMARYGDVFTPVETALVRVGEEAGHLDRLLAQIASYLEQEYTLRQMINRETLYPKLVLAALLAFPIVVPAIIASLTTGAGSGFVIFLKGVLHLLLLALVLWGGYALFQYLLRSNRTFARSFDTFKLNAPVIGLVVRRLALARFSRGLALLYGAGMGLPQAVSLSADLTGSPAMAEPMKAAAVKLESGAGMSEVLSGVPYMDDLALQMLRTGETTGSVDVMMLKVAEHFEEASETSLKRMVTLIMPVSVIILGFFVLLLLLKTYGGILNQALNY
jgi:type II secretory pathway component PulF